MQEVADIIVVGGGTSGLAAAITSAEMGRKVLIIEKEDSPVGVGIFAEGLFAVESDLQKHMYINYTCEEAYRDFLNFSHFKANPELVRNFIFETTNTVKWLLKLGVEFEGIFTNVPGGPLVWHIVKGMGENVIQKMKERCEVLGIKILYGLTATRLLMDGKKVSGIEVVDREGNPRVYRAKNVIIATGGYANNAEWIRNYGYHLGKDLIPIGHKGKLGEGIRMALEIGAESEGLGVFQLIRVSPFVAPVPLECVTFQPSLHVNQNGMRYINETVTSVFPFDANAISRQPERTVYIIFDEKLAKYWSEEGVEVGLGRIIPPKTKIDVLGEMEKVLSSGKEGFYRADSVGELARAIGIPEDNLIKTFNRYNSLCQRGYDSDFGKDPRFLKPLEGRLFAIRCKLGFLGTLGGLRVNGNLQVVTPKGEPIPGLFAAGLDAGGLYGDTYDVTAAGTTFSFALTSGRIAGRNASLMGY